MTALRSFLYLDDYKLHSFASQVDATPAYVAHWLPGTLIVGLGIGLTFPVLSAAAVSSLPAHRFAVGSAVNQTARQIGGAIGVAVLVMVLGTPSGAADAVTRFHHLWTYGAGTALLSGLIGSMIPRPSRQGSEAIDELSVELVVVDADLALADQPM